MREFLCKAGRARWAALIFVVLLVGCDPQRIAELEEGVATEADVRARFGEPAALYTESDGGRTFEYPRQPAGQVNCMLDPANTRSLTFCIYMDTIGHVHRSPD